MTAPHCLTIDVEEHFHVSAFDTEGFRERWSDLESRVERSTTRILDLLDRHGARATFFVLGLVAERHPTLVRAIRSAGHEVASHGHAHRMITTQTPEELRADVRRAKRALEDILGEPVAGYRAPSFTITPETEWALEILVEEGFRYDSSIVPVRHDRYGYPGADPFPNEIPTASGAIWEIPPSTVRILGTPVPVGGGGYLRLYPFPLFEALLRRLVSDGRSLVLYAHPWEVDSGQPRLPGSALSRFRQYTNLDKTERRLARLLERYRFGTIAGLLRSIDAEPPAEAAAHA